LLLIFFLGLGSLWVGPDLTNWGDIVGDKHNFLIKVVSLPQKQHNKYTYQAHILTLNGKKSSLKVKVNDYHSQAKKYNYRYYTQAKLRRRFFRGRYRYSLWIKKSYQYRQLPVTPPGGILNTSFNYLNSYIKKNLPPPAYNFLATIFLGRRELLSYNIRDIFYKSGLGHIFAISGMHIGLISIAILFILRLLQIQFRYCLLISILLIFFYINLIGLKPSTVRAAIMYSVFGGSFLLQRRVDPLNTVSFAGLIALLYRPLWINDIGFQFSFLAVLGIIVGFKLFPEVTRSKVLFVRYVKGIIWATIFVNIFLLPLVAFYFQKVYLLTPLANLLVIPLVTFILFTTIVFIALPFLGNLIAVTLNLSIYLLLRIVDLFASIDAARINLYLTPQKLFFVYCFTLTFIFLIYKIKLTYSSPRGN
jgi:competence protein ComEC